MEKKKIYGDTLKEQHLASARDKLYRFLLEDGAFRGAILHATRMVNEMRANHELGILESLVLGQAYIAAGLMAVSLKGNDRLALEVDCSGPIKGLSVEANAFGEVRGYLKNVPIPVEKPLEDFNLSPFYGAGFIKVTKFLEDAKYPFSGQVMLKYGRLAKDLAYYYVTSEQIPTAFSLSVQFDSQGEVTGAGGLFLQVMPGADEDLVKKVEEIVLDMPSLGEKFAAGREADILLFESFEKYRPRILEDWRVEFMCHCKRDRVRNLLYLLDMESLRDIKDNGPFPLELKCHNCATSYDFSREEIQVIFGERYPDN